MNNEMTNTMKIYVHLYKELEEEQVRDVFTKFCYWQLDKLKRKLLKIFLAVTFKVDLVK